MALCTQRRRWSRRTDRGMCCFFVHHCVSPICVLSPTPLLISGDRCGKFNLHRRRRGRIWACLQGNKGMVDWQHLLPYHLLSMTPLSFSFTCTCQQCCGWDLRGSICSLPAQCLFILCPSGLEDQTHTAELHLMCFTDVFCTLKGSTLEVLTLCNLQPVL